MIDFTKVGKIGDKVRNIGGDIGAIECLAHGEKYPVLMRCSEKISCTIAYTATGLLCTSDDTPSLMFANGSIRIDQGTPPKRESEELYCWLTRKQWKRIIHEEFGLGFSDESVKQAKNSTCTQTLRCFPGDGEGLFLAKAGTIWKCAAIPNIKGIRKPHFGGDCPISSESVIICKFRDGKWGCPVKAYNYDWNWSEENHNDIMEYIELP